MEGSAANPKHLWKSLACLVKPAEQTSEIKNLNEAFRQNVRTACEFLGHLNMDDIFLKFTSVSETGTSEMWEYVLLTLHILQQLKEEIRNTDLSVSQQKDVRSSLQFIVSLGILPSLLPGVGISLSARSPAASEVTEQVLTDMQKYKRLCIVVKVIVCCCEDRTLRGVIISNVLSDLIAALCQLSYAPLKKPHSESTGDTEGFTMTEELWKELQRDREVFKVMLLKLVSETYQPTVISQLMMLQGAQRNQDSPLWLKKCCSKLLTSCLTQPGGVAALMRATLDSGPHSGTDWRKLETLAKVITSPQQHYENICAQIVRLLFLKEVWDFGMLSAILACVKTLHEKDPLACNKFVLEPLFQPLRSCFSRSYSNAIAGTIVLSEDELSTSIECLYRIFMASTSEVSMASLPATLLSPYACFFFQLFHKVNNSASHLVLLVKDLLYKLLNECEETILNYVVRAFIFNETLGDILAFPEELCFNFGASGGVHVEVKNSTEEKGVVYSSVEEAGDYLILFLEQKDEDGKVSEKVFISLLYIMVDRGIKPGNLKSNEEELCTVEDSIVRLVNRSERHIGIVRLLAVLVEKPTVQGKLRSNPGPVLNFLQTLLEDQAQSMSRSSDMDSESDDLECVFVALMVLSVILDNIQSDVHWECVKNVLPSLKILEENSQNAELKRLASGMYHTILCQGIHDRSVDSTKQETGKSECEKALHDACDALLPVRGHAMVQLTKLLRQGDPETRSKKEAILCLFQENLKNDDSFIYLSAVNGMAALSRLYPETCVKSLTEEFIAPGSVGRDCDRNPEVRMKVGEVLVKLTQSLGEIAPEYKNQLLNAFLVGSRDTDHLIRASSLSNLGEVCRILGFRVGSILEELLLCIHSVVKCDKAVEPRRAAVMVMTMLLRGLEHSALTLLQDAMLEIYRTLKDVYRHDTDAVAQLHAQLALEEIGSIVKDFLFPKLTLEKRIHLL